MLHVASHTKLPLQPLALFRIDFRSELRSAKFLSLHLLSKRFLSDIYGGRRQKRGWSGLSWAERDGSRGREETAILVFHVKLQWITEAGLAFLRNTVSVIQAVITVLIMLAPHSPSCFCCSCFSLRCRTTFNRTPQKNDWQHQTVLLNVRMM